MIALLLALTLSAAEPAASTTAPPPLTKAEQRAADRAERARLRAEALAKVVCKERIEPGTSMRRQACLTQAEWNKLDRDLQNNRIGPVRPAAGMPR